MSSDRIHAAFTAPMETHSFAGILFDLDGTIVDSTDAIVKHWHESVTPAVLLSPIRPQLLMFKGWPRNLE